jgi:hypothetical protein
MPSGSVCQVARSWVDVGSFHARLVARFMNFTASVRNILDFLSCLTLTNKRHVCCRRWVVNVRRLRQHVDQPVVPSCDVLLNATNAANIASPPGTSAVETATAERSHTVCMKMMYRVYVTKNLRSQHIPHLLQHM